MDVEAELMFDDIAKNYEANFAEDPSLHRVIDQALGLLSPHSQVLDVGCGTGKPVSYRLAEAGHDVTGIDISQNMIDIATRQVKAQFIKTDMTNYEPKMKLDAIFAIFSLFNISRAQVQYMVSRFYDWLKPGGRLVLATIPSECLFQDPGIYDESGEWVDQKPMYFMGHNFCGSAATKRGWEDLFTQTGFEVEDQFSYNFSPPSLDAHKKDPDHLYYVVRRGC
ncbi:S-adenosyl-L-methionine-dependent methyltransferase [Aspergillus steynii IBT 23096]|uniref:phosphoethanolamine N-methyltransferase n=1 Tax=Aspergillus steynii IBT 23096 TaxID=1392250 RepID=A0A2I2G125_9EURO|nr:S-adenosyl-L-methionine-dependent methyltransferase [Aspergillus steynii IBT 23096]PLB46583.1 S-adenosyl-L-methionine-dependent methyltransferase [Aspergillus steynii IBT 23096]